MIAQLKILNHERYLSLETEELFDGMMVERRSFHWRKMLHNIVDSCSTTIPWPRIVKRWAIGVGPQLHMEAGENPLIRKGETGM